MIAKDTGIELGQALRAKYSWLTDNWMHDEKFQVNVIWDQLGDKYIMLG
jgi:hypothetical protein